MTNSRFDTNKYEFNSESRKGCYIIHGFTSTTYETKELAEFLGNNGYHTITENLPGHGTTSNILWIAEYSQPAGTAPAVA